MSEALQVAGSTRTGLDQVVDIIQADYGLMWRISGEDIRGGAEAADGINQMIVEAIQEQGLVNDGELSVNDVYDISAWIRSDAARHEEFLTLHGNDEDGVETGYHLVQNDGALTRMFAENALNTVFDGIYHIGFETSGDRFVNEDGDRNARVESVAFWLSELLEDDIEDAAAGQGALYNANVIAMSGSTGTGLDSAIDLILNDPELQRRLPGEELREGAAAADMINTMIVSGVQALGVADDGSLTAADVWAVSDWIRSNPMLESMFIAAHGDDENNSETGFHLVQNDGAVTRLLGQNAVNTVLDGMYHIGFDVVNGRFQNEDGDANARLEQVAFWLEDFLEDDLQAAAQGEGALYSGAPTVSGTTGTGLDALIDMIVTDSGLNRSITLAEIAEGAQAANGMNHMLIAGIQATGVANDGSLNAADLRAVSDWVRADEGRYNMFSIWHGDDEGDSETGFHLVQGDGGAEYLFGHRAVDTVMDGVYHYGFEPTRWGRMANEDGNANVSLAQAAHWLNELLADDLASGAVDGAVDPMDGVADTGTGLDALSEALMRDTRFENLYSTSKLSEVARTANSLNEILLEAIEQTGVANDGRIDATDIYDIDNWIATNRAEEWNTLNQYDDESGVGFRDLLWSSTTQEVVADGWSQSASRALYSLGAGLQNDYVRDADGRWTAPAEVIAETLNILLEDELAGGALRNADLDLVDPASFAGSRIVDFNAPTSVLQDDGERLIAHDAALAAEEATVSFTFSARQPAAATTQALFSKDFSGHNVGDMTMYLRSGELWLHLVTEEGRKYVKVLDTVQAEQAYDVAVSFGDGALGVYINGEKVISRPDLDMDWTANDKSIVIGAAGWSRNEDGDKRLNSFFDGHIVDFEVYDRALNRGEVASLALGVNQIGGAGDDDLAGSDGSDSLIGGLGADVLLAGDGDDVLLGGYGSDALDGGAGNDVLDGGHGMDVLNGGAGNDILISKSDGREQKIAQLFADDAPNGIPEDESGFADGGATGACPNGLGAVCHCGFEPERADADLDPDGEIDAETGKLYPDQPVPADDILTGGEGADVFRFQTLINAKYDIILKHVDANGVINWAGVAGENDELHDHWVDYIGDDVITDFNRDEGDTIEIAGHTTQIASITYDDTDGDGVDDSSTIYLISNQGGNGGAHDQDYLGSITVLGTILQESDVSVDSSPTYGIVDTIFEIDEAIAPLEVSDDPARDIPADLQTTVATDARGFEDLPDPTAAVVGDLAAAGGTGLVGRVYDRDANFGNVTEVYAHIAGADAPTHTFTAGRVDFGNRADDDTVATFLGDAGDLTSGDGASAMESVAYILTGYVQLPAGTHELTVRSDDGYVLKIGGEVFSAHQSPRPFQATSREAEFEGGLYEIEIAYYENGGAEGLLLELNGETLGENAFFQSVEDYETALAAHGSAETPQTIGGPAVETDAAPETPGSGLVGELFDRDEQFANIDALIAHIDANGAATHTFQAATVDFGGVLGQAQGTVEEFLFGSAALTSGDGTVEMDATGARLTGYVYIEEGLRTLTVRSDDGMRLTLGGETLLEHATPRGMSPTSKTAWFEGGLYEVELLYFENGGAEGLRFEIDGQTVGADAFYASAEEFEAAIAGTPATPVIPDVPGSMVGTTNTGLDDAVDLIMSDTGLEARLSIHERLGGAEAANGINTLIVDAIQEMGLVNDGALSTADVFDVSDWIRADADRLAHFIELHGDDENGEETGYHLVQGDGGVTRAFANDAMNTILDGIYHIGFETSGDRFVNEDGNRNARVEDVAAWLGEFLEDDIAAAAQGTGALHRVFNAAEDVLVGDGENNMLMGAEGADTLYGGGGDDQLTGGLGADVLNGGEGFDLAQYLGALSGVTVDLNNTGLNTGDAVGDVFVSVEGVIGSMFDDVLSGDAAANALQGAGGDDTLEGRGGDDVLVGGAGGDALSGGGGVDAASYQDALASVRADLKNASANRGEAAGDVYTSIENLIGSAFSDELRGDGGRNQIEGGDGDDVIRGRGGHDSLFGGDGDDELRGDGGRDLMEGGDGDDTLSGGGGGDDMFGGFGDDTLVGGGGGDDMFGGDGDDNLGGGGGGDDLNGGVGDDTLNGGGGSDVLNGGVGDDTLISGGGRDTFVFAAGDGDDVITDFRNNRDSLEFVGGVSFSDLTISDTDEGALIEYGADTITLNGVNASSLDLADFTFG